MTAGKPAPVFEIAPCALDGASGVSLHGEVDVWASGALRDVLDRKIRDSDGAFVVDLSELEFLDSSGLSVLMRARALLTWDERRLAVVCPPGPVRRLLDIAGVKDLLAIYDSRAAAADALL
jgi:anti-anti-sigma factor